MCDSSKLNRWFESDIHVRRLEERARLKYIRVERLDKILSIGKSYVTRVDLDLGDSATPSTSKTTFIRPLNRMGIGRLLKNLVVLLALYVRGIHSEV